MRKLKVFGQSMGGGNYTQVLTIILKGKWLDYAGFNIGEYVDVVNDGDKIILNKTTPPEPSTKKSLEENIDGLNKRQLDQLKEYIDKL